MRYILFDTESGLVVNDEQGNFVALIKNWELANLIREGVWSIPDKVNLYGEE